MDTVIRAVVVYLMLLVIFRIAGKRSLAQITTFDLVLTLIISEAIQQALIDDDNSMTNGMLLVVTLVGLNIVFTEVKQHLPRVEKILDGAPVVIVEDGTLLRDRMDRERVDEGDILGAAREFQGLARLDQIAYAVVEQSGHITVVPKDKT